MSFKRQGPESELMAEVTQRWRIGMDYERMARQHFTFDLKFGNADPNNHWQWPDSVKTERGEDKPIVTINKTRQYCLNIINEAKQNKAGIKVSATGDGANYDSAQVIASLIRRIEYQSKASTAYDLAIWFQVFAGIGYWKIETDYADATTFDQDIFIRRVTNPLAILMDCFAQEQDRSDANWAFEFETTERKVFEAKYPKYKEFATQMSFANGLFSDWSSKNSIQTAVYWRRVFDTDELVTFFDQDNQRFFRKSDIKDAETWQELTSRPDAKVRTVTIPKVERYFIVGAYAVEKTEWPGQYIPIIPVIGEEFVIDGNYDRRGHVRNLIDPQRVYNYWSATAIEYGALQTKSPWVAPAAAIEGYQDIWDKINRRNVAVIPYNSVTEDGQPIPPPQRVDPPQAAPVALQGMQIAMQEMQMVSGQYDAAMGAPGNERTGAALDARQRMSDRAEYHFTDNQAIAIRHSGTVIFDLIPKIYDTRRILSIIEKDGTMRDVVIDPVGQAPLVRQEDNKGEVVAQVLNPNLGKHLVEIDVGPAYATRRQEAFEAFKLILTQSPQLVSVIGDILFRAGDFPLADEAAERLKRMVPPQALGQGPSANEQALMQQLEQFKQMFGQLSHELQLAQLRLKGKAEARNVQAYDALTRRLQVIANQHNNMQGFQLAVANLLRDISNDTLDPIQDATLGDVAAAHGVNNSIAGGMPNG